MRQIVAEKKSCHILNEHVINIKIMCLQRFKNLGQELNIDKDIMLNVKSLIFYPTFVDLSTYIFAFFENNLDRKAELRPI